MKKLKLSELIDVIAMAKASELLVVHVKEKLSPEEQRCLAKEIHEINYRDGIQLIACVDERLELSVQEKFNFAEFIEHQNAFSQAVFGPGERTEGVLQHIAKEIEEVRAAPDDVMEWVDIILLAIDGALRRGFLAQEIVDALQKKLARNTARSWPDWRTQPTDQAIEHIRKE